MNQKMKNFIANLPLCELHCHIEGTMEPEMLYEKAMKNKVDIPYKSVEEIREAYKFNDLQSFLDIYYEGMKVLNSGHDFYDLTVAYMDKLYSQKVRHTEIFFDPQGHVDRVPFSRVANGIQQALHDSHKNYKITSHLIMCFLRHLDESSAFEMLELAIDYNRRVRKGNFIHRREIIGVGLDSGERGNPPEKFERVFKAAKEAGFRCVAHAGEEGPSAYIWQALDLLKVERIDHGNTCLDDPVLVKRLVKEKIPLTVCPITNIKIKTVASMEEHPLRRMLDLGLKVTVNSDDPGYFGGYINENFEAVTEALNLTTIDLLSLASNSIDASFISFEEKVRLHEELGLYAYKTHGEV